MPLYNYRCEECQLDMRVMCSMKERKDKIECIECKSDAKFIIGTPGLIVGKEPLYKSERVHKKERLAKRESRLRLMPKAQADDFRRLSKNITGGEF